MQLTPQKLPRQNDSESGIAIVIVLVAILLSLLVMRSVMTHLDDSSTLTKNVSKTITDGNTQRYIDQMISDDVLCTQGSDFMKGLLPGEDGNVGTISITSKPADYTLIKNNERYVDYSKFMKPLGIGNYSWPSPSFDSNNPTDFDFTSREGVTLRGKGFQSGVVFYQMPIAPIKNPISGLTRVPISVNPRITLKNGGARANLQFGIRTYVEFDKTGKLVACYRDISSRSLCLDLGGTFNPLLQKKCTFN
ncbi:MAG: hypothetical protein H7249_06185 [Chitinophagaceae bacterium]|nr:hypothetical protein [Oligoflexus sp.]